LPNKCFIFNRIANFEQNLQVEDFVMFVGWLSHPTTRQTNVAADSQSRLAVARRICSPLNLAFDTLWEEFAQQTKREMYRKKLTCRIIKRKKRNK
jgi:hypothetical protein